MRAGERRLEEIAANLANLNTAGYKRRTAVAHTFEVPGVQGDVRLIQTEIGTDFRQGDLERTGTPTDLALFGDGFFAVEGPQGEVYSRNGAFRVSADGILETADGMNVAWDGASARIDPRGPAIEVDEVGTVRQGDDALGRLRIVAFEDARGLVPTSHGFWHAPEGLAEATATAVVHQGALEASNVQGIAEMVEMIAVQRAYESAARTVSFVEESYRRLTEEF